MANRGLAPRKYRDNRRYSYARTFGSVATPIPDFIIDPCGRKNQNEHDSYFDNPPLPNGCTGFGTAGIAESDLKQRVDPKFTYDKTLIISGGKDGDQATLQDSFKSATVYGVRLKGESDLDALTHRRAPYFEVHPDTGDWYDAILSAVYSNQRPVSLGTTWNMFIENVGSDGIQKYKAVSWQGGHDHNIIGKKTINGVEYLIDDSWNGSEWGDKGLCYWDREHINALMKVKGSDALTNRPALPQDIKTIRLNIIQVLISLYYRYIHELVSKMGSFLGRAF